MVNRNEAHTQLQRACLVRLSQLGAFAWGARSGLFLNPRTRERVRVGTPGTPDIHALLPDPVDGPEGSAIFVGVECKTGRGRQNQDQKKWERRCNSVGACYIVVRSVEDMERQLKELGAIR